MMEPSLASVFPPAVDPALLSEDPRERFFGYARERHAVYLRRRADVPRPWTRDPILRTYRFTNIYRELDAVTTWFRERVREPMRDDPRVLPATVIFRWFNRVSTGEVIFSQFCMDGDTPFKRLMDDYGTRRWDPARTLTPYIRTFCGAGPFVTGAYTINTICARGGRQDKLDGVVDLITQWFEYHPDWYGVARSMLSNEGEGSIEAFCDWVKSPCLADFMAYEIACDLRYTGLLERALDQLTWANPGPGAARGLNRVHGRPVRGAVPRGQAVNEMRELLDLARRVEWPRGDDYPAWEMREVEHTLCEFDKHERVRLGEGRPRSRFNGG